MQKVERQKHKDRKRRRLTGVILCALLLVICVAVGLLLRDKAEKTASEANVKYEAQTGNIFLHEESELKSLTLIQQGKDPWTVETDAEGKLHLLHEETGEPSSWTVDENIAELLMSVATNLTYDDIFAEKRSEWEVALDAFGLKDPLVTAVFSFQDGTDVTVHVGKSADPENNRYYYMSVDGDEHLYAVSAGVMDDLSTEQTLLHPVPRLEIQSALLDRISVKNADGSVRKEWSLQGDVKDRDAAENWQLTAPFTYPADYNSIVNLKENAGNLRLGVFIEEANEETLKLYGFEEPSAILEFHTAAGSTGTVGMSGVFDVSDWEEHLYTLTDVFLRPVRRLYLFRQRFHNERVPERGAHKHSSPLCGYYPADLAGKRSGGEAGPGDGFLRPGACGGCRERGRSDGTDISLPEKRRRNPV